jgi:hypothetical protein
MRVYVVGHIVDAVTLQWELVGVFTTEVDARRECLSANHFIGPIVPNTPEHRPKAGWPGCYYPLAMEAVATG